MKGDELWPIINTIPMLPVNHSDPNVMILQLKERVKEQDINRGIGTKGRDRNKVFRHYRHMEHIGK